MRSRRVADLIRQQIAGFLLTEISDPRLHGISVTAVHVSKDLKQAQIFFTMLDKDKLQQTNRALIKARGYLRHLLADATELRYVPQLRFTYDQSVERGARMVQLIDEAITTDINLQQKDDQYEPNGES